MTIDARYLDLMQMEIDRTNSREDSADLSDYLARSIEAREHFGRLSKLSQTLDRIGQVDPPADLKANILRSIRGAAKAPDRGVLAWLRAAIPAPGSVMRYSYVFAAGLLVAIVGYQVAPGLFPRTTGIDPHTVAGTIGRPAGPTELPSAETLNLNVAGATGSARLTETEGGVGLEFDLDSTGPVRVSLGFDLKVVAFKGFVQSLQEVQDLELNGQGVSWTQTGHHSLVVILAPRSNQPESTVNIELNTSGKPVKAGAISLPARG